MKDRWTAPLESACIEFVAEDNGGAGVRLKLAKLKGKRK
jgi:hypothetical protein